MSYVKLLYHVVIRTKAFQPVRSLEHSDNLYRYIWGIIKNKNSVLYRINDKQYFLPQKLQKKKWVYYILI